MTQLYLTMPQPGETIAEGTIVQWLVKPGDVIEEHAALAELETEKAVFEYESPFAGKLVKLLYDNGTRVKVAEPIAVIDVAEDKAKLYTMMGIAKTVGESVPTTASKVVPAVAAVESAKSSSSSSSHKIAEPDIKMSPYVRKQVTTLGLDAATLQALAGQSPDGRITKDMLEAYIKTGGSNTSGAAARSDAGVAERLANTTATGDVRIEKCSAIRMRIADNMVLSKSKIPHAHNGIAVDVTRVVSHRDRIKEAYRNKHGVNLNFLTLIAPALIRAIKDFPMINASYDDSTNPHQIKYFNRINLGVAAGTSHGLVIPVIAGADALTSLEFNRTVGDKLARAEARKLKPDDLSGATLIFNNYGYFGTGLGVQVIQYPMAATLGMSAIEKRVVPVGENIGVRTMCDFVLSFDHRVMDGRETGMFLKQLKDGIEGLTFDSEV